ncbi:sugar transferase [Vibrio sp. 10N.261.51.F12]|uniref:sugar transferase n=1 Tax=Vibrio sp. 10N.261.51.F12 TaxID=3229679 RepID=UPI00354B32FF
MKRLIDFSASLLALILLSPIMLITAWQIKKKLGSPVLFKQQRPGLNGKPFNMLKFRSMKDGVDSNGNSLPDEDRLTPFGQKLRATSLDELPGLLSVLKGDMSLVGPRPLLMQYLPLYNKRQATRHHVRPGITGWAQVNGRNAISWEQKFEYDAWYVENQSLWLDMKILLLTVKKVLFKADISADGHVTIEPFKGTPEPSKPND